MAKAAKKSASPESVGALIDRLYQMRDDRIAKQRQYDEEIDSLKKQEAEIEQFMIDNFTAEDISKLGGKVAVASLTTQVIPTVKDWPSFHKYIQKTGEFDLLERRPGRLAFKERYEAGVSIPGVEAFIKKSISLRKIAK